MSTKPFGMAVSAFVGDGNGRFLMLQRAAKSKHFPSEWETPGGKMDPGETFAEALLRETLEETGLTVELDGLVGASEFELSHIHVVLLHMKAHVLSGDVTLSDEHDDYAWLTPAEFATKNLTIKLTGLMAAIDLAAALSH